MTKGWVVGGDRAKTYRLSVDMLGVKTTFTADGMAHQGRELAA